MAKKTSGTAHPVAQGLRAKGRVKAAQYAEVMKMTPAQLGKIQADAARDREFYQL
jgi:hypothetical protein